MKHDRLPRLATSFAFAGALALGLAFVPAAGSRVEAQGPPPTPPVPQPISSTATTAPFGAASPAPLPTLTVAPPSTASPAAPSTSASGAASASPTPAPRGRGGRGKPAAAASAGPSGNPEPSATPTSPAFSTLDGTWELQLQYIDRTDYSYLTIVQSATGGLTGTWKVTGKAYPLEGTYDGRLIKMVVHEPSGDVTLSGYVEGATDMVGAVDLATTKAHATAFTAEHRGTPKGGFFKKL